MIFENYLVYNNKPYSIRVNYHFQKMKLANGTSTTTNVNININEVPGF